MKKAKIPSSQLRKFKSIFYFKLPNHHQLQIQILFLQPIHRKILMKNEAIIYYRKRCEDQKRNGAQQQQQQKHRNGRKGKVPIGGKTAFEAF